MTPRPRVIAVICLVGLAACTSDRGPAYTERAAAPGAGEALVYVYRLHYPPMRNATPDVYIDGEHRGTLKDEGHLVYRLPQGKATIEVKGNGGRWPDAAVSVSADLQAERTHFFRCTVEAGASAEYTVRLEAVTRERGIMDLQTTRLLN